ncbi:MAG: hypothetical protein KGN16_25025 [Burkholderiales bacterium]|nr:hypothetical protein [Burkholderiales bacterium]
MTTTAAPLSHPAPAASGAIPPAWRRPGAAALAVLGLVLAWSGGWLALPGALAIAVAVGLARGDAGSGGAPAVHQAQAEAAGSRRGAEVMVAEVVPVWSRQMEVTRDVASDGLAKILNTFSEILGALNTLAEGASQAGATATPGAIDNAVRSQSPALAALTAASERAFAERDAAVAELSRCADGLVELQQLAKQARELARHTRLVAFNASIESNRQQGGHAGGSQAVASELRMLSGRIGETAEQIERVTRKLSTSIAKVCRTSEVRDTAPDELRMEIDISARAALDALLSGLGGGLQGPAGLQQTSRALADQVEAAFMDFQFGDRVSQMLSIIANDMNNFTRWVSSNPRASQNDAAEWLASLESSYTMDEQRSSHHGNVNVEVGTGVDFF